MSRIFRNGRDYSGSSAQIDDNTAANNKVYSSAKTEEKLADKQNATDNSLATTNKTVVGAINELNSGKAKKVLYHDYTGTTTSNGNLVVGGGTFPISSGVVVGAVRTDAESVVTYYQNTIGDYINFHVTTPLSTGAVIANTQVSIRVFYIPN